MRVGQRGTVYGPKNDRESFSTRGIDLKSYREPMGDEEKHTNVQRDGLS